MDKELEAKIILPIHQAIEESGVCSVKEATDKASYPGIKFSEQKRIARLVVQSNPLISVTLKDEIIIKKNFALRDEKESSSKDYGVIIAILVTVLAVSYFLLFKVFLPALK